MPIYRWNPLSVLWAATGSATPPSMDRNNFYNVRINYQNSSEVDWANDVAPGYRWQKPDGTPILISGLLAGNVPTGNSLYRTIWVMTLFEEGNHIMSMENPIDHYSFAAWPRYGILLRKSSKSMCKFSEPVKITLGPVS